MRGTLRWGVRDTRHPGVPTQTGIAEVEPDDSGSRLLPDGGSRELKRVIPPRESRKPSVEAVHGSLTETFSEGSDLDLLLVEETVRLGDDSRGNVSDTRLRRQDLDSEVGKCYQLTAARLSRCRLQLSRRVAHRHRQRRPGDWEHAAEVFRAPVRMSILSVVRCDITFRTKRVRCPLG